MTNGVLNIHLSNSNFSEYYLTLSSAMDQYTRRELLILDRELSKYAC